MPGYSVENALVSTDADSMWSEIEAAEKHRESCLANYDTLLRNAMATEEWPEALTFQYLSYMVPRIVLENPTVQVTSRAETSQMVMEAAQMMAQDVGMPPPENKGGTDALAAQHFLKRWILQEDFRATLDVLCDDYLKAFAVGHTCIEPMRGAPDRMWPRAKRIDIRRYLHDALALTADETAWNAHWYNIPKPLLEKKAKDDPDGWDAKAIKDLTPHADDKRQIDRKEVRVYEVWVRGYPGDEFDTGEPEFNGALLTLGSNREGDKMRGVQLRKPRPAYVPPWGPYTLYGCFNRAGSAWPMSPLLATFGQQEELQKHARAMNINARQYKRVVIVSDSNPFLVQQLQSAPDNLVIAVKDDQFDKDKVVVQEFGGISDQQLVMYGQMKAAIDRAIGMDDSQRGKVDADATATAVAVADESVATRVSYIEGKFIGGVRRQIRSILWYGCMDERVTCRLGPEIGEQLYMLDPWFQGGIQPGEDYDFNDLELEIDPYSMGRVSEQTLQRRVTDYIMLMMQMAPAMLIYTFVDWALVLRNMAQVMNLPSMNGAIDFNQLAQMAAQQAMMMEQAQATEMSGDGAMRKSKESGGAAPQSNARQLVQANRRPM